MAHFRTLIDTRAPAKTAFEYLADFSNARLWDPSVRAGRRLEEGPVEVGSRFEVELELAGRPIRFEYALARHEPDRLLVFEATTPMLRSLDTIEIEETPSGSRIHYDADLRLLGAYALLDAPIHLGFQVSGRRSAKGLQMALDRLA